MLVEVAEEDIRMYKLPDLIEPVLWSYAEDLSQYLSPGTWFALKVGFLQFLLLSFVDNRFDRNCTCKRRWWKMG